ncbi:MAG: hypothetical protein K0S44_1476 [Bacteroidetes bacterium]|jgi:hypothetical protein|nr:hypothetical protein [Bacteroidota bacterium]
MGQNTIVQNKIQFVGVLKLSYKRLQNLRPTVCGLALANFRSTIIKYMKTNLQLTRLPANARRLLPLVLYA